MLKDWLRLRGAAESTPWEEEYFLSDAVVPNTPCYIPTPDAVPECGLSELPTSLHSDDKTDHDTFFVQNCVDEVENADYATPLKPLFSMRGGEPLDEELDPPTRLRESLDSKSRVLVKGLCYTTPTCRS